ncbi:MAG TPA: DUF3365 domain-containing protein [Sandaracinaceae bacterium]
MPRRTLIASIGAASLLSLAASCTETEAPATEPPPAPAVGRAPATDAERAAVSQARAAAQHLGRMLKTRLLEAMQQGPARAARVCSEEAQALTARAATERNARVGRSSLRLRNEANEGPEWVRAWLRRHGERPAEGVAPASGIAAEPPVARFVAPIAIEGPCLACHGERTGIPEEVRSLLAERYPRDRATGYALGDLRGALWAEVPVASARAAE